MRFEEFVVGQVIDVGSVQVKESEILQFARRYRKLPRQVDTCKGDCTGGMGLGRNVRGGTRPRLTCGRSWL